MHSFFSQHCNKRTPTVEPGHMKITISILEEPGSPMGDKAIQINRSAMPSSFRSELIEWELACKPEPVAEDLLSCADSPQILMVDGRKAAALNRIQRMLHEQTLTLRSNHPGKPFFPSPIIAVLHSPENLDEVPDFPEVIADWVYAPVLSSDIAGRIFFLLKRRGLFKTRLESLGVTFFPEARLATYEDRRVHLTPSEAILLDLFLSQPSAVISSKELVDLFHANGKSTSANNIRVGIFQLRMVLESLTRSRMTLANVHKQGYCLRKNSLPPLGTRTARSPHNGEHRAG